VDRGLLSLTLPSGDVASPRDLWRLLHSPTALSGPALIDAHRTSPDSDRVHRGQLTGNGPTALSGPSLIDTHRADPTTGLCSFPEASPGSLGVHRGQLTGDTPAAPPVPTSDAGGSEGGACGCGAFQVYAQFRRLGYVVGCGGVRWTEAGGSAEEGEGEGGGRVERSARGQGGTAVEGKRCGECRSTTGCGRYAPPQ